MRRVLSISTLYPNAARPQFGAFVARQMEALANYGGWNVTVINPIGLPPVAFGRYAALAEAAVTGVEGGVTVHRPRFTLLPAVGGPLNPRMIVRAVLPLARRLHALAPFDLVDAQFFYPDGPAAAKVAADLGVPLSIKARGADISHWGRKGYALRRMRRAADQAAGLLAVSEALAADMVGRGLPGEKITVHYTGLDRYSFKPLDRQESRARLDYLFGLSLPTRGPVLATVGALIPRKGQSYVIQALKHLPSAHLLLVGDGPDKRSLESIARAFGCRDRVHFLGSIDHQALPLVMSAADAMVLPSKSEGLANAWVEALACGCPLVITEAGGAREVITRPEAGRIVPRNPNAIAEAVRDVIRAKTPREAVAESAARFSWQANGEALAAYYEGLLA